MVNRRIGGGYYLVIFNHSGVVRSVADGEYTLPEADEPVAVLFSPAAEPQLCEGKVSLEKNGEGFIKAMWCGDEECEDKVKELTGVGSRCIPFDQENLSDVCVCCGKPAKHMVYWGIAY